MNARERMLALVANQHPAGYTPAAFFMHFDPSCHTGQAAIDAHLNFFRATGMDFAKVQYEQYLPPRPAITDPEEWAHVPEVDASFFAPTIETLQGIVAALKDEALVVVTLYSPFMWARRMADEAMINQHLLAAPQHVAKGLEIMTRNVITLAKACIQAGVDGFYASSQGGEAARFPGSTIFSQYIKPTDLAVWRVIEGCRFNILHVCDYVSGYDDLSPFLDYPGHVVNCSLHVGGQTMTPREAGQLFGRPFMGGMERLGTIAKGNTAAIQAAVADVLANAPERFILGADCTVPSDTPVENLRLAIDTAHQYNR